MFPKTPSLQMQLFLLTSLQRLHYPVPYADFIAYWKEAERRGLAPWKWIVQFPLHKSEVNWTRSPVLVFNKNTPEWEQFGMDHLFELIDFEDIVIDVQASGEYDADRNNFQLTAGNEATILFHLLVSSKKVYAMLGSQCN